MKPVSLTRVALGMILTMLVSLTMTGVATAADGSGLLAQIQERGTIRIGMEGTYPPFNYRDADGNLVGFEVDFAKALTKHLGVKPDFVLTKWDGMLASLETKRLDVVINQVTITPEREKKYAFTIPYTISGMQIIVRDGTTGIDGPQDLAGKAVGVGLGTNYQQWLQEHVPGADVRTYQDDPSKLQDLRVGRLDAVINDRLMLGYLLKHSSTPFQAAGQPFARQRMGIALRKGNPKLLAALDDAIRAMKKDGEMARVSEKWFGVDVSQ